MKFEDKKTTPYNSSRINFSKQYMNNRYFSKRNFDMRKGIGQFFNSIINISKLAIE